MPRHVPRLLPLALLIGLALTLVSAACSPTPTAVRNTPAQATQPSAEGVNAAQTPPPATLIDPFAETEFVTWQSPNGMFSLEHPKSWVAGENPNTILGYLVTPPDDQSLGVGILIIPIRDLGLEGLADDAGVDALVQRAFLGQSDATLPPNVTATPSNATITPIEISGLKGSSMRRSEENQDPATGQVTRSEREMWVIGLDARTVFIIQAVSDTERWPKMEAVWQRIKSSLKISREATLAQIGSIFFPTPTITPTFDATAAVAAHSTAAALPYARFKSSDGLIEFEHPQTWAVEQVKQSGPVAYTIKAPASRDNNITVRLISKAFLEVGDNPNITAIEYLRQLFAAEKGRVIKEVRAGPQGQFVGGMTEQQAPFTETTGQLWGLDLDPQTIIVIETSATKDERALVDAVVERLTATLNFNVQGASAAVAAILTVTPTPQPTATPNVTPTPVMVGNLPFSPVRIGQGDCVGVQDPAGVTVPPDGGQKTWAKPDLVIDPSHKYCAIFTTEKGRIVAELYPQIAPQTVNSFVFLAQQGYYDNTTFHRVIQGFVAQGGDPTGTGEGSPGYQVQLEVNPLVSYDRVGVLGAARGQAPNSAGSQFFITYDVLPGLNPGGSDPAGYTIFGQVVEGMAVVEQLRPHDVAAGDTEPGDKLISVRIVDLTARK